MKAKLSFPYPKPYHYVTKNLLMALAFTWYLMSNYQENLTIHTKGRTHNLKIQSTGLWQYNGAKIVSSTNGAGTIG